MLIIDMVFSACSVKPQWRDLNEAKAGEGRIGTGRDIAPRSGVKLHNRRAEASSLSLWAAPARNVVKSQSQGACTRKLGMISICSYCSNRAAGGASQATIAGSQV